MTPPHSTKLDTIREQTAKKYKAANLTVNNPKGVNQYTKQGLTTDKKLDNYMNLCQMRSRQREIRESVRGIMAEYRSLSQKMDELM